MARSAGWNPTLNRLNWSLLSHIPLFLVLHETPHSPRMKASGTRDLSGMGTAQWLEHLTADPRGLRLKPPLTRPPTPYGGLGKSVCYMSYHEDNTLPLPPLVSAGSPALLPTLPVAVVTRQRPGSGSKSGSNPPSVLRQGAIKVRFTEADPISNLLTRCLDQSQLSDQMPGPITVI